MSAFRVARTLPGKRSSPPEPPPLLPLRPGAKPSFSAPFAPRRPCNGRYGMGMGDQREDAREVAWQACSVALRPHWGRTMARACNSSLKPISVDGYTQAVSKYLLLLRV
jgi:hypothetical protein